MSGATPTYILDANLLIRLADKSSPMRETAKISVISLLSSGTLLRIAPQSLFEFWVVATRPSDRNGLGLPIAEAENEMLSLIRSFPIIPDDATYVTYWRRLIVKYAVGGKQAHDARYVAAMQAHGLTHILTFDADFNRYIPKGITVIHPASVVAPTS